MFRQRRSESWNSTLEFELLSRQRFATEAVAHKAVARFIDLQHNSTSQLLRDALTDRLRAMQPITVPQNPVCGSQIRRVARVPPNVALKHQLIKPPRCWVEAPSDCSFGNMSWSCSRPKRWSPEQMFRPLRRDHPDQQEWRGVARGHLQSDPTSVSRPPLQSAPPEWGIGFVRNPQFV